MMFNKDLFLLLCEKYNVKMSANATRPMIKDRGKIYEITVNDRKNTLLCVRRD